MPLLTPSWLFPWPFLFPFHSEFVCFTISQYGSLLQCGLALWDIPPQFCLFSLITISVGNNFLEGWPWIWPHDCSKIMESGLIYSESLLSEIFINAFLILDIEKYTNASSPHFQVSHRLLKEMDKKISCNTLQLLIWGGVSGYYWTSKEEHFHTLMDQRPFQ